MPHIDDCLWPLSSAAALLEALAPGHHVDLPAPKAAGLPLQDWLDTATARLHLEAEPLIIWGHEFETKLAQLSPGIAPLPSGGLLAILSVHGDTVHLLTPTLASVRLPLETVRQAFFETLEQPHRLEIDRLVSASDIAVRHRARVNAELLRERLRETQIATVWQLRCPPGSPFSTQLRAAGLWRRFAILLAAHAAEYTAWLAAWWIIGQGSLTGRFDLGWLQAWALLLLVTIPLRWLTTWSQGVLATGGGGLLRQRLLAGALALDVEQIRHQGIGQLLARVLEVETIEGVALSGGVLSALALIEIALTLLVLSAGAAPLLMPMIFIFWTLLATVLAAHYWSRCRTWTHSRLALTHDLVERMSGHRTRLAQQNPLEWHDEEDRQLCAYLADSRALDHASVRLTALIPRGWTLVGLLGLSAVFLHANATTTLAATVAGLLLGYRALQRLTQGLVQLAGAAISWEQVAPLFHAAARQEPAGALPSKGAETIVSAHELAYQYPGHSQPVLRDVSLEIRRGDWLLLEGESGSGKSTLASLLSGLRTPTSGLLLASGLDRQTLGPAGWRRRIASAPQYHENHVLTGTVAFNLLMGRAWPPLPADLTEAHQICRELGLGPLLERMPGGILQMVGETGWQLSQGERSRLFIARTLLQRADLVVLDESFAALDPETLRQSLECVLQRAGTLAVVAHP